MVVPFDLLPAVEALMNHSHRFVPPSIQMVMNEFIKQSFLQLHIKNVWQESKNRKRAFLNAAQEFLPHWQFQDTRALHVLGKMQFENIKSSDDVPSDVLVSRKLMEHQIVSHSLSSLFFKEPKMEGLVLGYSSVPPSVITQKIQHWSLLF
jgi:GntR family transcriptional regulator/MocR family aminotransferase